jgi:hypothetical protein
MVRRGSRVCVALLRVELRWASKIEPIYVLTVEDERRAQTHFIVGDFDSA